MGYPIDPAKGMVDEAGNSQNVALRYGSKCVESGSFPFGSVMHALNELM
jgi:hypothetical protein